MTGGSAGTAGARIRVPDALRANHHVFFGDDGRGWIDALPDLAADRLEHWGLRMDGPPACGAVALVLPVLRADSVPAVLKLQPVDDQTGGEPAALRSWDGNGAVRVLDHDPGSGSMLLERLDSDCPLSTVLDDLAALRIISELLARLTAVPAPAGLRRLADIAPAMLERVPYAMPLLADQVERRLLRRCANDVTALLPECGDRLLHWDLHYGNVLAPPASSRSAGRESWLAIDPKPLVGDPGFELLPALWNRWDDVVATGNMPRAVRRRFDLMTEILGLERERARGWTLGRILQNALWDLERFGRTALNPAHRAVAESLLGDLA